MNVPQINLVSVAAAVDGDHFISRLQNAESKEIFHVTSETAKYILASAAIWKFVLAIANSRLPAAVDAQRLINRVGYDWKE